MNSQNPFGGEGGGGGLSRTKQIRGEPMNKTM